MIIQILYLKEQALYAAILNAVESEISLLFRDSTDKCIQKEEAVYVVIKYLVENEICNYSKTIQIMYSKKKGVHVAILYAAQFSSGQLKTVSMCSEKPICAPLCL